MDVEVDGILVAAHELKAPLAVIRQMALSFDEMNSRDEHIRSEMISVSERAIRQVNDLTKIARLDEALFEMEPVNPRAVCDEVVNELWQWFKFNRRELSIDYRNKRRLAVANTQLLHSVVYNFCLNAMNYGGEELPSEIAVYDRGAKIRIEVRDFGPTIPTKIWREIKDGFVKKPVATPMRPGSSGLGLYIASRFSSYMHSDFGLIRHRDGTSFYIDLPVSGQLSFL